MSGCFLTEQGTELSPSPFPQLETSDVLDKITNLRGELPTWATHILKNVSRGMGRGWGLPQSRRWAAGVRHMGLPPQASPALSPHPGKPARPVLMVPGIGGRGCWFLGLVPAQGSSLSCRKVSVS